MTGHGNPCENTFHSSLQQFLVSVYYMQCTVLDDVILAFIDFQTGIN